MPSGFYIQAATTPDAVAAAQAIRTQVFVVEQGIPAALDADGLDAEAFQVVGYLGTMPVATGRLTRAAPGHGVVARIAVLPVCRGQGLGAQVVEALEAEAVRQGLTRLTLHPHAYLEPFYARMGYTRLPGSLKAGAYQLLIMEKMLAC